MGRPTASGHKLRISDTPARGQRTCPTGRGITGRPPRRSPGTTGGQMCVMVWRPHRGRRRALWRMLDPWRCNVLRDMAADAIDFSSPGWNARARIAIAPMTWSAPGTVASWRGWRRTGNSHEASAWTCDPAPAPQRHRRCVLRSAAARPMVAPRQAGPRMPASPARARVTPPGGCAFLRQRASSPVGPGLTPAGRDPLVCSLAGGPATALPGGIGPRFRGPRGTSTLGARARLPMLWPWSLAWTAVWTSEREVQAPGLRARPLD